MSHRATNWAVQQRGLKPATKIVLWHLCDRHNPDQGCFPSQVQLAYDCEMSRASLNTHLSKLEEMGLIRRVADIDPGTKKQLPTRYYFAFEQGEKSPDPVSRNQTRDSAKAESRKSQKPSPENGESRVQNLDSNPVREPVKEPLGAQAREGENSDLENRDEAKRIEREFKAFAPNWPTWVTDSEPAARKAWFALSDAERDQAVARCDDYLAAGRQAGRTKNCALAKYLAERKWERLGEPEQTPDLPIAVKPFGKLWMAYRLHLLDLPRCRWHPSAYQQKVIDDGRGATLTRNRLRSEFPKVWQMDEAAMSGKGVTIPQGLALPHADGFVSVKRGTPSWDAWMNWYAEMDYPFIDPPEHFQYVWFPAEIPVIEAKGAAHG